MAIRKRPVPVESGEEEELVGSEEKIVYAPYGSARDVFTCKEDEILLAGPAGTGKSLGILQKSHLMLSKYPKSKGFMARKTRASMTNSCMATFQDHVLHVADKVHLHKQDQQYNYPNGSIFAIVGLDDPEKIKSTDWDFGYIQEATECTLDDWEIATTRLRNWKIPYQQLMADCNPDKPNHWLKLRCDSHITKLMPSHHEDNPMLFDHILKDWTPEGKKYLKKLQRLSGVRYKRLYRGLWVAAEGMVYETWDPLVHMVSPAELPLEAHTEWHHYWSIDWGYIHPFCWQDWIENPYTGQIMLYRQIYKTQTIVPDVAREIMELTSSSYVPRAIICDHDAGDRATFERFTGYHTLPAYKPIQQGVQAVQKRLKPDWNGQPGLLICRDSLVSVDEALKEEGKPTCTEEEIEGYIWDKKITRVTNSKKDELPVDLNNHGQDGMRYMVAFIDNLAEDPDDMEGVMLYDDEERISRY